jgi:hypothetical protein
MRAMDAWTVLRISLRRWRVSLPILVVSLGLGLIIAGNLDPLYSAKSSAILAGPSLVPENATGRVDKVNPFLTLGGSLYTTTQVVSVLMDSEPKRAELTSRGLAPGYKVDITEAVITFQVTGTNPRSVVENANTLVKIADGEMVKLQGIAKVSTNPASRIRVVPLAIPEVAVPDSAAQVKLFAIFSLLGLIAAITAAITVDAYLRWRHSRTADAGRSNVGPAAERAPTARMNGANSPKPGEQAAGTRTEAQPVGTESA